MGLRVKEYVILRFDKKEISVKRLTNGRGNARQGSYYSCPA